MIHIPSSRRLVAAAIVAAAALTQVDGWSLVLAAFGILNVLVAPVGTSVVRALAIVAVLVGLLAPPDVRPLFVWYACLAWMPAMLIARAAADRHRAPGPLPRGAVLSATESDDDRKNGEIAGRLAMGASILAVSSAVIVYRLTVGQGLQQTAALFVGIPALLAAVVAIAVTPRTAAGVAFKTVTVGLLISLTFLNEGILCVVMSAPLFYGVAMVVVLLMELARGKGPAATCVALLALVPASSEGTLESLSFNRDEQVTQARLVPAPLVDVQRALLEAPRFDRPLPLLLRAGFPRPVATRVEGAGGGIRLVIRMRGGEMRLNGLEPRAGDLVLELEDHRPGFVRWRAVSDDSHMTHFLDWRGSSVHLEAAGANATRVTWMLQYRRGLDPAWYFGPLERYAATLAAGYLIDAVATP
jgi:hypothetical protein